MPHPQTAESPSVAYTQFFERSCFSRFHCFATRYGLLSCSSPWADLTGVTTQPTGTFTPELSTGRSPFPRSGTATVVTEQLPPTGLAPARTTTKLRCTEAAARY